MTRWIMRLIAFTGIGVVTTLFVAFLGSISMNYREMIHETGIDGTGNRMRTPFWRFSLVTVSGDHIDSPQDRAEIHRETVRHRKYGVPQTEPIVTPSFNEWRSWSFVEAGWPAVALWGYARTEWPYTRYSETTHGLVNIPLLRPGATRQAVIPVPYLPVWSGLAINSAFFGSAWLGVFAGIASLRRSLRRRRGQCAGCGYDLQATPAHTPCPECGHTLKHPA